MKLRATILLAALVSAFTITSYAGNEGQDKTVYTRPPAETKRGPFSGLANLFRPVGKVAKGTVDWAGAVTVGTVEEASRTTTMAAKGADKAFETSGQASRKGIGQYLNDTLDDNK